MIKDPCKTTSDGNTPREPPMETLLGLLDPTLKLFLISLRFLVAPKVSSEVDTRMAATGETGDVECVVTHSCIELPKLSAFLLGGHDEVWSSPDTLGETITINIPKTKPLYVGTMSPREEVRNDVSSGGGAMSPQEVRSSVSSGGKKQQSPQEVRSSSLHRRKEHQSAQELRAERDALTSKGPAAQPHSRGLTHSALGRRRCSNFRSCGIVERGDSRGTIWELGDGMMELSGDVNGEGSKIDGGNAEWLLNLGGVTGERIFQDEKFVVGSGLWEGIKGGGLLSRMLGGKESDEIVLLIWFDAGTRRGGILVGCEGEMEDSLRELILWMDGGVRSRVVGGEGPFLRKETWRWGLMDCSDSEIRGLVVVGGKARSGIEELQLNSLAEISRMTTLVPCEDRYVWTLESDGVFSVASIRKEIDGNRFQDVSLPTRWVKSVPIKVNIIAWKVKSNALPTRFNISRRGMDIDSIVCPICNAGVESTNHIFFQCVVVRQIMRKISSWWNIDYSDVNSYEEWRVWLVSIRIQSKLKGVLEGVYYGLWWYMWNFRNKLLFDKKIPEKALIFDNLVSSSFYWCKFRCKASFKWDDWLKNPYIVLV
ncbi:RNA-directed DNA polymerase, eukaryota [Tanacetum coccineum]